MWREACFIFSVSILIALTNCDTPICQHGFTLVNNKCLRYYPDLVNRTVAERKCAEYDGTLVTVKNAADNSDISQIAGASTSLVWIGLYCFDSLPSSCYWDDGSGAVKAYDGFQTGFPITDIGQCVYYSNEGSLKGKWLSSQCDIEKRPFICELPTTYYAPDCQYNYNGYCYQFMPPLPYDYAKNACQEINGHLVSIHSANENTYLSKIVISNQTNFLIGARYSDPGTFSWSDGSPFDYSNIDPSMTPFTKCIMVSYGQFSFPGFWEATDCKTPMNFICKRPLSGSVPQVTVAPLPSNPSNCNSSVLMAPGFISSPNYPYNYDNNLFCTYRISTLGSYNVLLHFFAFSTEQDRDIVTVYDGDTVNSQVLRTLSGTHGGAFVTSTGNSLVLTFQTDERFTAQGFQARFTAYAYGR